VADLLRRLDAAVPYHAGVGVDTQQTSDLAILIHGMGETEAIRVEFGLESGLMHDVMGNQQGIEFLHDAHRLQATQSTASQAFEVTEVRPREKSGLTAANLTSIMMSIADRHRTTSPHLFLT